MQVKLSDTQVDEVVLYNGVEVTIGDVYEVDTIDQFLVGNIQDLITEGLLERVWSPSDLVIWERIPQSSIVDQVDFTTLGLRKETPKYDKGRKTQSLYYLGDKLCVTKDFEDIIEDGILVGIEIIFTWFRQDGEVGHAKRETAVRLNKYEAVNELRKRRGRQLDTLVAGASGTPLEPYVDIIFNHYYDQALRYREKGTSEFMDAINNETDPQLVGLLAIPIVPGYTLKMSLLSEIA